ncbi:hypothetical protein KQX54_019150 [Cotesia glomerata]|uniref:Uncharacterized protein n=1 Tax=Cotesia glomerata TaxID=32391 RepID=A0AAV7I7X8_COTGL|nr:hypothetical protein KQX54_019150 [Cotesia glomerata]
MHGHDNHSGWVLNSRIVMDLQWDWNRLSRNCVNLLIGHVHQNIQPGLGVHSSEALSYPHPSEQLVSPLPDLSSLLSPSFQVTHADINDFTFPKDRWLKRRVLR